MAKIQKIALMYVLTLIVFFYGYAVARFQIPPHAFLELRVQEVQAFVAGDALDRDTTIVDKIKSDTGLVPKRFLSEYPVGIDDHHLPLVMTGLNSRRDPPEAYINDQHLEGFRVIFGAMDFEESLWGALLISPEGEIIHTWQLSTEHLPLNKWPDTSKVLYGTYVGKDGSIIFSMQQNAGGIVKVDACSNEIWNVPGRYHHTVTSDDNGAVWSFTGVQGTIDQDMVKISVETGEILQTIDMTEVRKRNPDVHLWHLRNPHNQNYKEMSVTDHMTHGNDIEALTEEFAASFEQFEVGDLLISYASTNLVFILDPDTLEVKWWRVGIVDYQHDPDWEADGRISIFNNQTRHRMHGEKFSEIVSIDPKTYESEVTYSGEKVNFKSMYNGRHQLTKYDTRMITSSNQGWAFEIDNTGEIIFSFINTYNKAENKSLFLSKALRYPTDYFEGIPWEGCESHN